MEERDDDEPIQLKQRHIIMKRCIAHPDWQPLEMALTFQIEKLSQKILREGRQSSQMWTTFVSTYENGGLFSATHHPSQHHAQASGSTIR